MNACVYYFLINFPDQGVAQHGPSVFTEYIPVAFKQAVDQLSVNIVHGMQLEIYTADPAGSVAVQHPDFLADRGGEAGLPSVKGSEVKSASGFTSAGEKSPFRMRKFSSSSVLIASSQFFFS